MDLNMTRYKTYNTNLTDVTSFSGNFETRVLSARPEFTGDFRVTLTSGFSAKRIFEGYNFSSVKSVMLSTTNHINIFETDYTLSSFNFYNEITAFDSTSKPSASISANYPEVSGFPISTYSINNNNVLTIEFPAASAVGNFNIIVINPAGYGIFTSDVSGVSSIEVK